MVPFTHLYAFEVVIDNVRSTYSVSQTPGGSTSQSNSKTHSYITCITPLAFFSQGNHASYSITAALLIGVCAETPSYLFFGTELSSSICSTEIEPGLQSHCDILQPLDMC